MSRKKVSESQKKVHIGVTIPREYKEELQRIVETMSRKVSFSAVVAWAIKEFLDRKGGKV